MRGRGIGRAGRPGLVGTMARTAVVAGTATAVSNRVSTRQANRQQMHEDAYAYQQQQEVQQVYASSVAPSPPPLDPTVAKLQQLAQLHANGALTDAEFEVAKARVIGV